MERFAPALRRVSRELDLPRRTRAALLLEMAADLEAVYEHHRGRGVSEEEAARRAETTVLGSSEVIRRLGRLHASPWQGWAEEVGARLSGGVDLVLVVLGLLPVLAVAGGASVWVLASAPTPLAWAILALAALMTTLVVAESIRLLRGRPAERVRLPSLLVLAAMAPAVGLLGLVVGVQRAASGLGAAGPSQGALADTVARDGAALLAGLLVGIAGLLAWFLLVDREARRAAREVEALLDDDPDPAFVPRDVAAPDAPADGGRVFPLVSRRHG